MPTVVTNEFKFQEGGGNVEISATGEWICSLMNSHVTSGEEALKDYTNWYTEVSAYEASGTGYTSGTALTNVGWYSNDATNKQILSADSVTFTPNVTIDSYGVCIWRLSDGLVMGFVDFGLYSSSNGNFTINWNPDGILAKI